MNIDYNKEAREWMQGASSRAQVELVVNARTLAEGLVLAFAQHLTEKAKSEEKAPERCGSIVHVKGCKHIFDGISIPRKPDHEPVVEIQELRYPAGTSDVDYDDYVKVTARYVTRTTDKINELVKAINTLAKKLQ